MNLCGPLTSGEILLADGATGTMLQAAGLPLGKVPEQWNIERPEEISALYRAYLAAGSRIILTNTFGGSRIKLDRAGCGDIVAEANKAAARMARQAAGDRAFVAGDMGPCGELLQPYGLLAYADAVATFAEQATALAQGGVDCIWIETMASLEEAQAAIEGARQATSLPILCSMSFDTGGRTMMGVTPEQAIERLWPLGLAACGSNCGQGPEQMVATVQRLAAASPEAILIAKPNAGLPQLVDGQQVYHMPPEEMARYMMDCVAAGARVIGSCCGSTPNHIRAIAAALAEREGSNDV